jgi:uncharacterized protein
VKPDTEQSVCWSPSWSQGFEHVLLGADGADSVLLAMDEAGKPFRLHYSIRWDGAHHVREAHLQVRVEAHARRLILRSNGLGRWTDEQGHPLPALDGCIDIDIWPTPLTNSLPLWRSALQIGERREFRMAWISAPELTVEPKPQAYSRLGERSYLFESLDGTAFKAELEVDDRQVVIDYPNLFRRVLAR